MRHAACEECRQSHPMKEMYVVFGRSLCPSCAKADLAARGKMKVPEGAVRRAVDPTICAGCGRDNGDWPLTMLGGGVPVCPDCERTFRHPVFPGWVRAAFTSLIVLAVVSCIGNWRFFRGYLDLRQGMRSLAAQDLPSAMALLDSASERVPESTELAGFAALVHGRYLLGEDRAAEALPYLRKAELAARAGPIAADLILNAEAGAAFNRKDYDEFLERSRTLEEKYPREPVVAAQVASALACKWAVSGDAAYKQQAVERLDRARQLAGAGNAAFEDYEGLILYRLDSREIITRDEYRRRFPNGYLRKGAPR